VFELKYPKELHDLHSDYPLAPENRNVNADLVSDFSKGIYNKHHGGHRKRLDEQCKELIFNGSDKTKIVVPISNLKYNLDTGLILTKIHRFINFKQHNWLKEWIDFNTDQRTKATNDFDNDLLIINE
jgi:hypothetical protein